MFAKFAIEVVHATGGASHHGIRAAKKLIQQFIDSGEQADQEDKDRLQEQIDQLQQELDELREVKDQL